ncbi:plasmid mobilization protein [Arvimicrobium flavum]|uniref:plasmid mobilization protein n=1 Tax=Arvimicrobium flavum TaxID=3393320 RepID=UPI00237A3832|nr:hypothetical protein [Mesorhizobium shangrilense]
MTSGTDTRQRSISLSARFSDEEAALVRDNADQAGVSVASLIRMALLDEPRARATRRPAADTTLVARLIRDLGPVADQLRLIAAHPDAKHPDDARLSAALDHLADMSFLCLQAMGRTPRPVRPAPQPVVLAEPLVAIWQPAANPPEAWPEPTAPTDASMPAASTDTPSPNRMASP